MVSMKILSSMKKSYWLGLFIGITTAYFVWLVWNKITELVGDSDLVLIITGTIVILAIVLGFTGFKKLATRFM